MNSPHKGPVTRKMFPFDDVIMIAQTTQNETWTYFLGYSIDVDLCQPRDRESFENSIMQHQDVKEGQCTYRLYVVVIFIGCLYNSMIGVAKPFYSIAEISYIPNTERCWISRHLTCLHCDRGSCALVLFCFWSSSLVAQHTTVTSQWARWRLDCLLNRLFRRISKKTAKLGVIGLCEGNPAVIGGFPSQRASNAENVSIWWRHHELGI